jgi:hypothetical protein
MTTINFITQKNICAVIGAIMGLIIIFSAVANANEKSLNPEAKKFVKVDTEENLEIPSHLKYSYLNTGYYQINIMDEEENQVYCGTISQGSKTADKELLAYILKSDFLLQVDNMVYYRINE